MAKDLRTFLAEYEGRHPEQVILLAFVFGVAGYFLRRGGFEEAPLVLGFILGPIVEASFRQALTISEGSFEIFWTRPIAAVLLATACVIAMSSLIPRRGAGGWRLPSVRVQRKAVP